MVDFDTDRNVFQGPGILNQVLHPFVPREEKKPTPLSSDSDCLSLTDTLGKFRDISHLSFLSLQRLHSTQKVSCFRGGPGLSLVC
jgi:hypothetical protein